MVTTAPIPAAFCSTAHEVKIRSPRDAREHGIFMVMQSPSLVPELPLFENLMMFDPRMRGAGTLLTPSQCPRPSRGDCRAG